LVKPGNLYGGFRSLPPALAGCEGFKKARKVLLVRDPRDVLVSEYFSNAYSHSLPVAGQGASRFASERERARSIEISDYVSDRLEPLRATCAPFLALKDDPSVKVFRYEDVIFAKDRLIEDVCRFFDWNVTEQRIGQILSWADKRPDVERPTEFVRRVTPGDYESKLPAALNARIADEMSEFMRVFGYR
jgi:hypothetical protein